MESQTTVGLIITMVTSIAYGFQRAYLKAKSLDPNVPNAKPFYKTSEFWMALGTALIGALTAFNGAATP